MAVLEWGPALALDVPEMDRDHQNLIHLMQALEKATKGTHAAQAQAFRTLMIAAVKHFSDEEAYMKRIGYAELESHQQIHKQLVGTLEGHFNRFAASQGNVPQPVFDFLNFWLKAHIQGIDRRYSAYAHKIKAA